MTERLELAGQKTSSLTEQLCMDSNSLYYGDNLDILRRYVQAESVDLIYLGPSLQEQSDLQRPISGERRFTVGFPGQSVRGYLALG